MNKSILLAMLILLSIVTTYSQQIEIFETQGAIQIDTALTQNPDISDAGTIQWNSTNSDFEGWDGSNWKSLTDSNLNINTSSNGMNYIYDIDNNKYNTIIIGTQTWMRENLKVTRFNDGTIIPERNMPFDWENNILAWKWPDNDPINDEYLGKLYKGETINMSLNGGKNICPAGWHVPNYSEWLTLLIFIDDPLRSDALYLKGKRSGNRSDLGQWREPNDVAFANVGGFNALPAGFVGSDGFISNVGLNAWFWTNTDGFSSQEEIISFNKNNDNIGQLNQPKGVGASVRCIKD